MSVGLSARELSRLSGLPSKGHVAMIEAGTYATMSVATAIAIARVLGCSLDWLILGSGKQPSVGQVRVARDKARRRTAWGAQAHGGTAA